MIREIQRLRSELNETDTVGVGQYGIEAELPKAKGVSDPISKEVVRREKKSKRQIRLEKKVGYIQDRIHLIKDDREQTVLDCILDGMSNVKIARHMGLSEMHIRRIKESISESLSNVENVENVEKMQERIDMA